MESNARFGEILEEADGLPLEDQETLIEVLQRRMRDRRRAQLARDIEERESADPAVQRICSGCPKGCKEISSACKRT